MLVAGTGRGDLRGYGGDGTFSERSVCPAGVFGRNCQGLSSVVG